MSYLIYRNIPEGTGWILDGFPSNYNQAKVLEKALTGFGALDASKYTDFTVLCNQTVCACTCNRV
jgi:adenylate kinase family enzyme